MVKKFLNVAEASLAIELYHHGFSQHRVAAIFDTNQGRISEANASRDAKQYCLFPSNISDTFRGLPYSRYKMEAAKKLFPDKIVTCPNCGHLAMVQEETSSYCTVCGEERTKRPKS